MQQQLLLLLWRPAHWAVHSMALAHAFAMEAVVASKECDPYRFGWVWSSSSVVQANGACISLLGCALDEHRCWDLLWWHWWWWRDVCTVYVVEKFIHKHIINVHDNWCQHAWELQRVSGWRTPVVVVVSCHHHHCHILFSIMGDDYVLIHRCWCYYYYCYY